ncbi:hypothetical protein Gpo141_00011521 [Globisporangium polare]
MKSFFRLAVLLGLLCPLAGASAASDRSFKPPASDSTSAADAPFKNIKTAVNFGATGAKLDVWPSGDCTAGQVVSLSLSRLEEINPSGSIVATTLDLGSADGQWSELTVQNLNGVTAMATTFNATLLFVSKDGTRTDAFPVLSMTAAIFSANATATNGNQSVSVPAGGVKFTVAMSGWPFQDAANSLRFAVAMKARGKGEAPADLAIPQQKKKNGTEARVNRLDFGEGMFMDAPSNAVLDGVDANITATIETTGTLTEYVWVFPSFTNTLYYDPVVSSDDASTSETASETPAATTTTTTATRTSTPSKSSALPLTLTGVAATTVAALALVFF